jgi:hypothetical protein
MANLLLLEHLLERQQSKNAQAVKAKFLQNNAFQIFSPDSIEQVANICRAWSELRYREMQAILSL